MHDLGAWLLPHRSPRVAAEFALQLLIGVVGEDLEQ
jgi:hypothetical protein